MVDSGSAPVAVGDETIVMMPVRVSGGLGPRGRLRRAMRDERRFLNRMLAFMVVVACCYVSGAVSLVVFSGIPRPVGLALASCAVAAGVVAFVPAVLYRVRFARGGRASSI